MSTPADDHVLLIYDGECRFCRLGMDVIRRLDRGRVFRFCPFGHPMAELHLADLPPHERYASYHAAKNGILYSATAAARLTLESLPLGRLAVGVGLHHLYPLIARNRSLLGRLMPDRRAVDTCPERAALG